MFQIWPWSSGWPPPTGSDAAHTVKGQLLRISKLTAELDVKRLRRRSNGRVIKQSIFVMRSWAENNPIISTSSRAGESASGIILRVVQGLLHPPGTLRGSGHWPTISAVHEIAWHLSAPGLVGAKLMGILKPSTLEMSKKSRLLNWFRANSARVFGGLPHPVHCNTPPQSPVSHEPLPLPSKLQFLRPHIRAMAVPGGTLMFQLWPRSSRRPPPTGVAAAHTV
nr:hypothetical protein C2845_PM04G30420 [Ipomoea batatas]